MQTRESSELIATGIEPGELTADVRDFFESAPVGFVLVHPSSLALLHVNRRFAAMVGYAREQLGTMPLADLLRPQDVVSITRSFAMLARGERPEFSFDWQLRRSDGSFVPVNAAASKLGAATSTCGLAALVIQEVPAQTGPEQAAEPVPHLGRELAAFSQRHPANPAPGRGSDPLEFNGTGRHDKDPPVSDSVAAIAILRDREQQLALNLAGMTRLQALSTQLVRNGDFQSLLTDILSASADLTGTEKGTIEFYDPDTERLELVVHQGLGVSFIRHISAQPCAASSRSVRDARRVMIEDVTREPDLRGSADLEAFTGDGIRAVQSTPLVSRDGRILGTLNNHFRAPHRPAEHELRLIDLLARMAADFIERSQAEAAMRESGEKLRRAIEIETVGIIFFDTLGSITDANDAFLRMSGYTRADLENSRIQWEAMTPPEWMPHSRKAGEEFRALGRTIPYERECIRKDGTRWWALFSATRLSEDEGVEFILDITERKAADEELRRHRDDLEIRVQERTAALDAVNGALRDEIIERLRAEAARQELQRQLASAQEEERRRISRELHDEVGQHITALMLGLKSLESTPPSPGALESLQAITETVGKEIHDLALRLRPTALDDLGLLRTLSNLIEQWSAQSMIEVDFHSAGWTGERLPAAIETTVYRIIQEALTNVLKHAGASRVSVLIERRPDQVTLIVEDDGVGFDVENVPRHPQRQCLGLLGMKERAALMNGDVKLESSPGKGTTIFVRIPLTVSTPKPHG